MSNEFGEPEPGDVTIRRADKLSVEPIDWLWLHNLARGKLHICAGAPGSNKTTLAVAIGATLSQAGRWPDGSRAPRGSTLFWSGEDGIEDTLLARFMAHGADLSRIHFITDMLDADFKRRPFDPALDMDNLSRAAAIIDDLAFIVIDPIVLTVRGDANSNGDVRRGLAPVVQFAERRKAAVFGVTHFTKGTAGRNPIERVTGSLGFGAAARIVFAVGRVPEDQGGGRIMVRAKSNLGPDGGGYRFAVTTEQVAGVETIRLEWGEPLHGTAHELLSTIEKMSDPDECAADNDADVFLREVLIDAGGSMNRKDVLAAAKRAGYPERTVEHARSRCRIVVKTTGFGKNRHSLWTLASIAATNVPTRNSLIYGSNDSNDVTVNAITAINHTANAYARATAMGEEPESDADAYRKATRGE